jgi:hypothetical protein
VKSTKYRDIFSLDLLLATTPPKLGKAIFDTLKIQKNFWMFIENHLKTHRPLESHTDDSLERRHIFVITGHRGKGFLMCTPLLFMGVHEMNSLLISDSPFALERSAVWYSNYR